MSKYFLYYTINSNNQLLISFYHNDVAAKIAFRLICKEKKNNPLQKIGEFFEKEKKNNSTRKTGELPENVEEVNQFIIDELIKIQTNLAETKEEKTITEVLYSGDVNLGFGGSTTFPTCLLDGSIHQLFTNHSLFAKARVFLYLESHNLEITQKAAEIHLQSYAQKHDEKYPNMPVVIRVKGSKIPYYTSPTNLQTIHPLNLKISIANQNKKTSPNNSTSNSPHSSPLNSPVQSTRKSHFRNFFLGSSPNIIRKLSKEFSIETEQSTNSPPF